MVDAIKKFVATKKGKICIAVVAVVLAVAIGFGSYGIWLYQQPKFRNVTMELGEDFPPTEAFLTAYAKSEKVQLLTAQDEIDLTTAGETVLIFQHGGKSEEVTLTVQDTTAPTAEFVTVTAYVDEELQAEDFVRNVSDLSEVTVAFAGEITEPESYGNATVEVVVTDACGNAVSGICKVNYVWLKNSFTLEYGDTLEKSDLLLNPQKDAALINQADLDVINASPVGTYTVYSRVDGTAYGCIVTVEDTTAPELTLQDVTVQEDAKVSLDAFIVSASDLSGEVVTRMTEEVSTEEVGAYTVTIEAEDIYGNVASQEATLIVVSDSVSPEFSGMSTINIAKNQIPDYTSGVSAVDAKDGQVSFTYDASKVDITTAGTYYVTYSAVDKSGNEATYRRKVVVAHDAADTDALVKSIAASLPNDAEAVRDYVRNTIWYSHDWGGSDPVWYGFKEKTGNCYVHALCLKELLDEKGYETQLIWADDYDEDGRSTHYWLIINLNGTWWHIDPTPGTLHSRYSLMNDAQRYETLPKEGRYRDWDRTKWPACG